MLALPPNLARKPVFRAGKNDRIPCGIEARLRIRRPLATIANIVNLPCRVDRNYLNWFMLRAINTAIGVQRLNR